VIANLAKILFMVASKNLKRVNQNIAMNLRDVSIIGKGV